MNNKALQNMVDGQLRPNGINQNAVIDAFSKTPREYFVSPSMREIAYSDSCVDIGDGRFMLKPMVTARMIQSLGLEKTDSVLILGAGTGYVSAVISAMVAKVTALEEDKHLRSVAINSLYDAKCTGVKVYVGSVNKGWAKSAPYNKIMLEIPVNKIPNPVIKQLVNGGKITALIHKQNNIFTATTFTKSGKNLQAEELLDTEINFPFDTEKNSKFEF